MFYFLCKARLLPETRTKPPSCWRHRRQRFVPAAWSRTAGDMWRKEELSKFPRERRMRITWRQKKTLNQIFFRPAERGAEWHLLHQHDGCKLFSEVDQRHLSALLRLPCSGGKERYVRELPRHGHGRRSAKQHFRFAHWHKSPRNHGPHTKTAEKLDPALEKSFSQSLLFSCDLPKPTEHNRSVVIE